MRRRGSSSMSPARPLQTIQGHSESQCGPGPRAKRRRDRVPRARLSRARARSDRRRAHHVRSGELGALPPQDLQRRLDRRRRARRPQSLFAMIRHTHAVAPQGTVVAYSDNAAVIEGGTRASVYPRTRSGIRLRARADPLRRSSARPTTIRRRSRPSRARPPARAARSATKARPGAAPSPRPASSASRCRTCASRARCSPGKARASGKPERIASALDIMLEGPIGAAAFNNEFGRPNLCGYFRAFEMRRARLPQADHARGRARQPARPACPQEGHFRRRRC